MVKNSAIKNDELKELLSNIRKNDKIRFFVFLSFLILSFALKWLGIAIPYSVIVIIALLFLSNAICEYFVRKVWPKRTVNQVSVSYFILQLLEVAALLFAISEIEGVLFGGIAILLIYVMFCYLGFTQIIYPRLIALFCFFGYIAAGLVKYLKILPYTDLQGLGINPYDNGALVFSVMSFMVGAFFYASFYMDIFSRKLLDTIQLLRARTLKLKEREGEIEEVKNVLEIRVKARTKELRELTKSLNKQVQQRTEDLQEKVRELERFQKLSVGRELKMVELKKEIKRLKSFLEKK